MRINPAFFGWLLFTVAPMLLGAIIASFGIREVPGWLGVSYVVGSIPWMTFGFARFFRAEMIL